jgi:hypothetical protein
MSRPRVYATDSERLKAWRERQRNERKERSQNKQQSRPCSPAQPNGRQEHGRQEHGRQEDPLQMEQMEQAVERLEFITECLVMKGYCSAAEATDMKVLVRIVAADPALFKKWRRARSEVLLCGLIPWRDESSDTEASETEGRNETAE